MSYFVVNQTRKQIYKMAHRMESYFEVLEGNPLWTNLDDIVFVDNDVEPIIGNYMKLDYKTNLDPLEIPLYLTDPDYIVWYMDANEYSLEMICRAINVWEGNDKKRAEEAMEDMLEWKEEQKRMHGYEEPNDDEDMLCHAMNRAM